MRKTIGSVLLFSFFAYRAFSAGPHDRDIAVKKTDIKITNEHKDAEKHAVIHEHEARKVKSKHEKNEKNIKTQHNEKIEKDTDDHAHEKNEKPDAHEKHEKNEKPDAHEKHEKNETPDTHEKHEKNDDHDDHAESGKKVGVGYGVEEHSETLGFKLSAKALQHFNIKISPVGDVSNFIVPKSSLVQFKDEIGLFIVTNKYIKRITGTIETKTGGQTLFKSNQIKKSDQYVMEGADFLRIVEISLEGEGIQGHSH